MEYKRERSSNYTREETNLLVALVKAKKHIIENKKSDARTWQNKERAWKSIEMSYNRLSGSIFRNHKHLKIKYEAIKRDTRKKCAIIRAEREKTGGSLSRAPVFTPVELKVKDMILSVEGNVNYLDSNMPCTSTSGTLKNGSPAEEQNIEPPNEQTYDTNHIKIEISDQDNEFPETVCDNLNDAEAMPSESLEKTNFDILTEEKIEIAEIQKQILEQELEQKLLHRKMLEKELVHKDVIHELEKQHILLKIELLKKALGEK